MSDTNSDSYETDNIMIVGVSTCVTHVAIVLFYFWLVDMSSSHHPFRAFSNFDLVIASLWSLGACTFVSIAAALLRRLVPYFPPAWLAVPVGSIFLFIFSMALFGYWNSVSTYSPDNPFRSQPPPLDSVLTSAFWIAAPLSGLTTGVAFAAYVWWFGREKETELHLN